MRAIRLLAVLCLASAASAACASGRITLDGVPGQWWSPLAAAKWGGLIGGGFGSLGGILGALMGWLVPKGKGRNLILGAQVTLVVAAVVALVAGIIAVLTGQPFWVYYPLLLIGFIGTVVLGGLIPLVLARYREVELRMMNAQDAGDCRQGGTGR